MLLFYYTPAEAYANDDDDSQQQTKMMAENAQNKNMETVNVLLYSYRHIPHKLTLMVPIPRA